MSDLALIDKNLVPPQVWSRQRGDPVSQKNSGFAYYQQETNYLVEAPTWPDLIRAVKKHRTANVIPIGLHFEREVEEQIADRLKSIGASNFVEAYQPPVKYPLPKEEWPSWAKAFALLKSKGDEGVGDTIERLIGVHNSARFKEWYKEKFGRDCGCHFRKEVWNHMYAYQTLS